MPGAPDKVDDPEWTAMSIETLKELMKQQIARGKARLRLPDAASVRAKLPPEVPQPEKQVQIIWYLATFGYQPKLTTAWMQGGRAFREDSSFDRVHGSSLFWIVTRPCLCFY
jgi:hypothetical protein